MPITIKTQTGNKAITRERLEQLLNEGKVKPTTKAVSIDDGATWISVDEALRTDEVVEDDGADGEGESPSGKAETAPVLANQGGGRQQGRKSSSTSDRNPVRKGVVGRRPGVGRGASGSQKPLLIAVAVIVVIGVIAALAFGGGGSGIKTGDDRQVGRGENISQTSDSSGQAATGAKDSASEVKELQDEGEKLWKNIQQSDGLNAGIAASIVANMAFAQADDFVVKGAIKENPEVWKYEDRFMAYYKKCKGSEALTKYNKDQKAGK